MTLALKTPSEILKLMTGSLPAMRSWKERTWKTPSVLQSCWAEAWGSTPPDSTLFIIIIMRLLSPAEVEELQRALLPLMSEPPLQSIIQPNADLTPEGAPLTRAD
jgi:hypothetical protein